jgi:hypothetical protein
MGGEEVRCTANLKGPTSPAAGLLAMARLILCRLCPHRHFLHFFDLLNLDRKPIMAVLALTKKDRFILIRFFIGDSDNFLTAARFAAGGAIIKFKFLPANGLGFHCISSILEFELGAHKETETVFCPQSEPNY